MQPWEENPPYRFKIKVKNLIKGLGLMTSACAIIYVSFAYQILKDFKKNNRRKNE
jgi:hypothetical protein